MPGHGRERWPPLQAGLAVLGFILKDFGSHGGFEWRRWDLTWLEVTL